MAIRMMTDKKEAGLPNVEIVTDYRGHATTEASHHWDCQNKDEQHVLETCHKRCSYHDALYMKTTHVGLVLELREFNMRDDSDFYAIVWNSEKKEAERVDYASTRGWTYPNGAVVDATPEVLAQYDAYLKRERVKAAERERALAEADPTKGKTVEVIRGRKHKGKVGRVFWRGANQFRTYYRNGYNNPNSMSNQRVGIETERGEKFFTAASQVKVVGAKFDPADVVAHRHVQGVLANHGVVVL